MPVDSVELEVHITVPDQELGGVKFMKFVSDELSDQEWLYSEKLQGVVIKITSIRDTNFTRRLENGIEFLVQYSADVLRPAIDDILDGHVSSIVPKGLVCGVANYEVVVYISKFYNMPVEFVFQEHGAEGRFVAGGNVIKVGTKLKMRILQVTEGLDSVICSGTIIGDDLGIVAA